jgi:hypothetical protein
MKEESIILNMAAADSSRRGVSRDDIGIQKRVVFDMVDTERDLDTEVEKIYKQLHTNKTVNVVDSVRNFQNGRYNPIAFAFAHDV